MKLIQLNIWQGKLLKNAVSFLKEQDADFVCLQEVYSSPKLVPLVDMFSTLETLKKELGYTECYFEPTQTFQANGLTISFGNAILSKHPFASKRVVFTNGSFHESTHADDLIPNIRNAQLVTVLANGIELNLINHHGYHELTPEGSEQTAVAMQKLVAELKKLEGPLVLAGDLNVIAQAPAMRVFDNWLKDLTATYNVRDTLTEFGKVRNVPCDHILVSKEARVKTFSVSPVLVSDHTPLILEFDL